MKENFHLGDGCEYYEYKGAFGIPTDNVSHAAIMNFLDRIRAKKQAQGIEAINAPTDKAAKYLIDGALFITLPDGKIYNANGVQVK